MPEFGLEPADLDRYAENIVHFASMIPGPARLQSYIVDQFKEKKRKYPEVQSNELGQKVSNYTTSRALGTMKELKFHELDINDAIVATGGNVQTSLNLIPQGITEITRIGRAAFIRKCFIRMTFQITENNMQAVSADVIRVMIVLDKQCNKANPVVGDIISGTSSIAILDFNNLSNKQRFLVLYDKNEHIAIPAAGGNGTTIETCRMRQTKELYLNFKEPIAIEYTDGTGDLDTITSNNLVMLLISLAGITKFDAHVRLRFTD